MYQVLSIKQRKKQEILKQVQDDMGGVQDDNSLTPRGWAGHAPAENGFSTVVVVVIAMLILFILWEVSAQSGILADLNYQFNQKSNTSNGQNDNCIPALRATGDCGDNAVAPPLPPGF